MKKNKDDILYAQKIIRLNNIINSCPGKSGLRLAPFKTADNEIYNPDIFSVYWDGADLDIQAMMFNLSDEESLTDREEDLLLLQFSVSTNSSTVFFGFRLSEEFTSYDLSRISEAIKELMPYVKTGVYSIDDFMAALYSESLDDDDLKNIRMSISLCSSLVEREIYPSSLANYDELVESGKIADYLPNQMVYDYSEDMSDAEKEGDGECTVDYTFVSLESGLYFKIGGKTEDLMDLGEMTNAEMYLAKLNSMKILVKHGKEDIIKNLPSFFKYICVDIGDEVKPDKSYKAEG